MQADDQQGRRKEKKRRKKRKRGRCSPHCSLHRRVPVPPLSCFSATQIKVLKEIGDEAIPHSSPASFLVASFFLALSALDSGSLPRHQLRFPFSFLPYLFVVVNSSLDRAHLHPASHLKQARNRTATNTPIQSRTRFLK